MHAESCEGPQHDRICFVVCPPLVSSVLWFGRDSKEIAAL